jgi:hypothetical protein
LIANLVAALVAVVLPLAAIFDPIGTILGEVLAGSAGPAGVGSARLAEVGPSGLANVASSRTADVVSCAASARNGIRGSIAGATGARTAGSVAGNLPGARPIGAAGRKLRRDTTGQRATGQGCATTLQEVGCCSTGTSCTAADCAG